jgi:GT2 family glycosyltransferase
VIATWRARELLRRCLTALADEPCDVIVVDNASRDGTAEMLRGDFPGVRVVALSENAGFGRAVNIGAGVGSGETVVLVNDDVIVAPGFVEALTRPLADPAVGMVAGRTTIPGGKLVDAFGIELDVTLLAYNRGRLHPLGAPVGRLAMPSGGAAAYRRSAFDAAGGFDETLFAYGEDVDLGLRLRAAGWRAAQASDATGVHVGGHSAGLDSPLQRRLGGFARGFLLRRYGVLRTRFAARALLVEALVCGWGVVRHRTTIPITARLAGWRAAGRGSRPYPHDAVDRSITLAVTLHRLRDER